MKLIWPYRVKSFLNYTSIYLIFILSWVYLQCELLSIGYRIACLELQAFKGETSFFVDSFVTLNVTWILFSMFPFWFHVLLSLFILPHRLTFQGGYSRWILIFFLVYFYPLMCLTGYRKSVVFLMHSLVFFSSTTCSTFLFDMLRCVCFSTKQWNSGDHEIYVPG